MLQMFYADSEGYIVMDVDSIVCLW